MAAATTVTTTATICLYAYKPAFLHACTSPPPAAAPLLLLLLILLLFFSSFSFFFSFVFFFVFFDLSSSSSYFCSFVHHTLCIPPLASARSSCSSVLSTGYRIHLRASLRLPPFLLSFLPSFCFLRVPRAEVYSREFSGFAGCESSTRLARSSRDHGAILRICDKVLLNSRRTIRLFPPSFHHIGVNFSKRFTF